MLMAFCGGTGLRVDSSIAREQAGVRGRLADKPGIGLRRRGDGLAGPVLRGRRPGRIPAGAGRFVAVVFLVILIGFIPAGAGATLLIMTQ